jgi:hypothetical protein
MSNTSSVKTKPVQQKSPTMNAVGEWHTQQSECQFYHFDQQILKQKILL